MKISEQRGSVLITTFFFVFLMVVSAWTVIELAQTSYNLTMSNEMRLAARSVAESELEYMLYSFKQTVVSQAAGSTATPGDAPAYLSQSGSTHDICDNTATPTTIRQPFLAAHRAAGWTVKRGMVLETSLTGTIPGTTKVGTFTYITALVEVLPPAASPFQKASVRVGRRFINSNTSLFQYSIFFQGDLELNPGSGNTIINGDIVSNGSIYMGPRVETSASLRINGKLRFLQGDYFNQVPVTTGTPPVTTMVDTYVNPNAPPLVSGVTMGPPVGADGTTVLDASTIGTPGSQVETQQSPENLLGGIDATAEAKSHPELFGPYNRLDPSVWTAAEQAQAENNVYRSLIVPPPSAGSANEYPNTPSADDDVVSVRRAYNKADLIVTVEADNSISVKKSVTTSSGTTVTDVTAIFGSALATPSNLYDEREAKTVKVMNLNVGALKTVIDTQRSLGTFDFQGFLYVNLKNSSATSPAAVRLTNAATIPSNASTGVGFSIATNGGLYIQGNYNTSGLKDSGGAPVTDASDGHAREVPSMIMADAITVLSSGWVDPVASGTPPTLHSMPLSSRIATDTSMVVNAGLVTGNYASTTTSSSGGAQNLVRYMEDWTGKNTYFKGSLGRLFSSTQFNGAYAGGAGTVYNQPTRTFSFDSDIPTHPPPGNPTTTEFGRGDFFTW